MCGIAGHAGPQGRWAPEPVLAALARRGPDASGFETVDEGSWTSSVAHTRLAINDLSDSGDQPLYNEDDTVALVFNGEIYNSPELRRRCEARGHVFTSRSDGEVIVHLWEEEGPAAFRRLNGIFAVALQDRRDGTLVLARDPLGVKPLFWSAEHGSLWFASELEALKVAGAPLGGPDVVALAQFLTFLWIPDPRTPFMGAHSLEPGTMLTWQGGRQQIRRYVDVVSESADQPILTVAVAEREFRERFVEATRRQLLSDVPVAIMASGGIDSSLLWWAAKDQLAGAYTIDWSSESGSEGIQEDTEAVRVLAKHFGTATQYVTALQVDAGRLLPSGDLLADPAVGLSSQIAEAARSDGRKVLLSGHGGDELLGGYRRHLLGPIAARVRAGELGRLTADLLAKTPSGSVKLEYAYRLALSASKGDHLSSYMVLCSYSDASDRAAVLGVSSAEVDDEVVWQVHRSKFEQMPTDWSLLRRFRALDLSVYMPGLGLAYADRSGMEHSVEVRVPWLDLDLVRWALQLPDKALVRGRQGKHLSRSLAAEVLPGDIANRPKRGFGAPSRLMPKGAPSSSRGFRQARYLTSATEMLQQWRAVA